MNTTHRFTLTEAQLRAILAEKFGIPEGSLGDISAETSDGMYAFNSLDISFTADFKVAAKVAKKVERFQGVEESDD